MDGWVFLVILYIIFMLFSALIRKSKPRSIPPSDKKKDTQKNLQATFEGYVNKIEDYLSAKQPPPLPQQAPQTSKILSIPKKPKRRELYPETPQPETLSVHRLVQEEDSLPELRLPSSPDSEAVPSILSFGKHRSYVQGIIMAEVLGPPVSKKRRKGSR
jgi:hypothetical protein